jgi:hypothetical protein
MTVKRPTRTTQDQERRRLLLEASAGATGYGGPVSPADGRTTLTSPGAAGSAVAR